MGLDETQERDVMEHMRLQAKMTRVFYDALIEQRFPRGAALALTQTWLQAFHARPPEKSE